MRRAIRIGAVATGVFLLVLIARFPASWALPVLPEGIRCEDVAGTIWHGRCGNAVLDGTGLGSLTWRLRPAALLTGRAAADLALVQPTASARGAVEWRPGGPLTVRDLQASLPLDPAVLPAVPPNLRGQARADIALLRLEGRAITDLAGVLELHDLQQVTGQPVRLGSYRVSFPQARAPGGEPVGELVDLGGPLAVQGTVRLTPEPGYEIAGSVAARPEAAPQLAQQLQFLGAPDAQGRRPFSLAGTY